jgi:colanic acid/amylovoran biosynthesis glycosyltransferase
MFQPYWTYADVQLELLKKLSNTGHKVFVFHAEKNKSLSYHIYNKDIIVYSVPHLDFSLYGHITKKYPVFINYNNLLQSDQYELVVIQSPLFLSSIQGVLLAKKNNKPSILEVHGTLAYRSSILNIAQKIYLYAIGQLALKKSTLVRCLTPGDREEVIKYGCPMEKIRIVPNPVDTDLFKPSTKKDETLLIWTGRMVAEKGLLYLVAAIDFLVHQYSSNIRLIMIGTGPLMSHVMDLTKKCDLTKNISFLGDLPRIEVARYLSEAGIFVFPSIKEGMPLSVLEAMSSGLAVVATDISGVKDLIINGKNGLLVPNRNPQALAKAIYILINDRKLRNTLSFNAREHIINNYCYQKILGSLENLFKEACYEKRGIPQANDYTNL